jgi:hypothetical protein
MSRITLAAAAVFLFAACAVAQPKTGASKSDAPKGDPPPKPGDHGMVLATAMEVAPGKLKDTIVRSDTKNYVFRGKLITLNKERTIHMCFDTELMRVAGVWKGPYPGGVAEKNMGPTVEGEILVATTVGPGWSTNDDWKDPRPGQEGPLPANWAHFKGLYLHGDQTILSYSVGDVNVLEMPSAVEKDGMITINRMFWIGPSKLPLAVNTGRFVKVGRTRDLDGPGQVMGWSQTIDGERHAGVRYSKTKGGLDAT